jgi:hypothetical protein
MVFGQEMYIGDPELSSVGAPTIIPTTPVSKRDGAGGSFEGSLRGRIGTGVGEDDRGISLDGGGRCQRDTVSWQRPCKRGGASA